MYRGRDAELRIYESKKRFYLMKAEEFEEFERDFRKFSADEGVSEEFLVRLKEDYEQKKKELARLREETIAARRSTEDRLKKLDRQLCEVLYLKYVKQMTVAEICAKLCYSMQRIYQLLNKGVDLYCASPGISEEERREGCL